MGILGKIKLNRRLVKGMSILVLFTVFSNITLLIVRKKILNNVQVMGQEISSHLLSEESKKTDEYEIFLKVASKWLGELINKNASYQEIQKWLNECKSYIESGGINTNQIETYAVVDKKIIGATYWDGDETFDVEEAVWYNKAINSDGKIIYTDVYNDSRTGKRNITLALKINDKNDILAIDIYNNGLMSKNKHIFKSDVYKDIHFYLCDRDGKIIYIQSKVSQNIEDVQKYITRLVEDIKLGKHSSPTSYIYDLENIKRGVYYSYSDEGWLSIVTIPYSVLLSEVVDLYYLYIGSITLIFIVGIILYKRENKKNKEMEETNETIRILGNSFYGIYKINFKEKSYMMIKGTDYFRSILPRKGEYEELEKNIYDVIDKNSKEEFKRSFSIENMEKLVKSKVRDFGGDFKRRIGQEYRWSNVRLLFDESLNPNEIILCFKDIDEEKKKSLEYTELLKYSLKNMEEITQTKNIFFSSMSHDMRTPLNGIIGLSELAKNHINNPDEMKKYLEKINGSSKQLLNLINDILELSKIEFNKKEILEEEFSLKEKLDEVVDIFKIEAERANKYFDVKFNIVNENVKGDFPKINQILNNLLSNAFKYTKEKGTIIFNITEMKRDKKSNFFFEIIDTGCGMSKEFLERIYKPFERDRRFGAKGVKGTGLGMAIVKNLVTQLEGEIDLESELGKGTRVKVIIPLEIVDRIEQNPKPPIKSKKINLKGYKILVAEDNEINMEIITELLALKGIEVIQAWNGIEAVEIFKGSNVDEIDMILMDMQMPVMNGCDAAKEIRKLSREDAEKIPIIAVTANAFTEDITATTMAGMNSHISKPIDFTMLDKILEKYLIK